VSIDMPTQMLRAIIPAVCPRASCIISKQMEQIIHHLSASMPVKRDEEIYSILHHIVGTDYASATTEILKLTIYLLSNKLLDIKVGIGARLVCDELLKWFQMGDNYLLLKAILSHRLPTIEAFAEGIFTSALEAEDRKMVRIFLDSGMNPNIIIGGRPYSPQRHTALQFATQRDSLGLVELLLKFEVDVDLIATGGWWEKYQRTPLQIAARKGNMEIAQLLISRGAAVNEFPLHGSSVLQNAVMAGNFELAKVLLDRGANINAQFGEYGCPLECAIRTQATSLVEMLLECDADINCRASPFVNTPLQSAAMVEDHEMVRRLLQLGADANAPASNWENRGARLPGVVDRCDNRTALQWAAKNGNFHLCQVLMMAGADLNAAPAESRYEDEKGITTLAAAVSSNNYQLVELLLKHGAKANDERGSQTALETAARLNYTPIVRLLLADPRLRLGNSVIFAVENQNSELISTLLKAGADINKIDRDGRSALSVAVEKKDSNLVQFLLSAGANPNPNSGSEPNFTAVPLVAAVELGDLNMIKLLLRAGADCNQLEEFVVRRYDSQSFSHLNALQTAAAKGNIDVLRHLLIAGAELNCPAGRYGGRTALQAAVESRNLEVIQFIIDQGADLNSAAAQGMNGATALQAAVSHRDVGLVRTLLAAGANANDVPSAEHGMTSLQRAAANGDDDLIRLLLDHGADINWPAADFGGRTALQVAAECGHYQTVQLLLARGANADAPACFQWGLTALQAAAKGGYLHIADVLLEKGASVNVGGSGEYGYTALEAAASYGRIDMLKLLLNAGADITTDFGRSQLREALTLATSGGHDAAARFLKYHQIC
jgi:ankyrin repeat protein